ncbi:MAG: hypothetical protein HWE34_12690 [Methylocystaceae bacterium]|jgi:hypothetical protein|nr:hypothetical protein [Methylocystaceae bacterium]
MTETTQAPKRRRRRKKAGSIEEVRTLLCNLLPSLIQSATVSYEAFSDAEVPEDAKGFAAHHAACKAALSHVELLTKLVRWAEQEENPTPTLSEDEEIAGLLAGARAALKELEA